MSFELKKVLIYFVEVQFQKDKWFYYRFFTEIFVYLGQNKIKKDWYAIAVYFKRSTESTVPKPYRWLISSPHLSRVYLNELGETADRSVGLGMVQLIAEGQSNS